MIDHAMVRSSLQTIGQLLQIRRPLTFFDLETTGLSAVADRIVQVGIWRMTPDGDITAFGTLVNPQCTIPSEATQKHKITDADITNAPLFSEIALRVLNLLTDTDLAGYNVMFDIEFTTEELKRAGYKWSHLGVHVIDAEKIFKFREPRTLTAALKHYLNIDLGDSAHDAVIDSGASALAMAAQLELYDDLPRSVEELSQFCFPTDPSFIDAKGKLRWRGSEAYVCFGSKNGQSLRELVRNDMRYVQFMITKAEGISDEVRDIFRRAAQGRFPVRTV